jgi:UDP-N-acetylglucosamine--N-acetylmuramyl-(pentapeptide) pyrophosphoryl-undecaprenol N-acetylglucosamine transferase
VVHQCGRQGDAERITAQYAAAGVDAEVVEFMDDMARRYQRADLCVCRSGAMTVSELAIAGCAAVFVPFPHATHDHQRLNAAELVAAGAAQIVAEKDLQSTLGPTLDHLLGRAEIAAEMGRAARRMAKPEAARKIVAELADLMGLRGALSWD